MTRSKTDTGYMDAPTPYGPNWALRFKRGRKNRAGKFHLEIWQASQRVVLLPEQIDALRAFLRGT